MKSTFNLVYEPWVPVIQHDGVGLELGLRDVLLQAHKFRSLHAESPPIAAALYRLLLAMLHRVVRGPRNSSHWVDLWRSEAWDQKDVDAYLDPWIDRFDLFHPEFPFYQHPAEGLSEKQVIDLLPELASGNNATLFDHHTQESDVVFSPAQAARALLFVQACSFAGGSGLAPKDSSDAPWARGVIFLVEGVNLFETLALNLLPYQDLPHRGISCSEQDRPIWEAEESLQTNREIPLGYLDYLTWPTRAIHLQPETYNGKLFVRHIHMGPGQRLNREIFDPFNHYRQDPSRGNLVYRLREDRSLWRDSASFIRLQSPEDVIPPETIRWLADLVADGELQSQHTYRYMALGMVKNQAKVELYRAEHLPLPGAYLQNDELVSDLSTALQAAENVRSKLGAAMARTASLLLSPSADDPDGHKPDRKDVNNLLAHWAFDRFYWGALEIPFSTLIETLPDDPDATLDAWNHILQQTARQVYNQIESYLGDQPRAMRASVRGGGQLAGSLKKLFGSSPAES